jgi:Tol biopolymer transport system component
MQYPKSISKANTFFAGRMLPTILILSQIAGSATIARGQTVKPELFGPGVISGPINDAAPAFTPDGQTVYFHRSGPALGCFIFVSHLKNGKWSMAEFASFSGQWQDLEPAMAPDGSYMIFSSNRPATPGGHAIDGDWGGTNYPQKGGNLWRVDRKGNTWSEPYRLPDIINGSNSTFSPAITADGSLYFMKPVASGKFHLYHSAYHNGQFEEPLQVSFSAADSVGDVDPAVSPDDSFLVFSSSRSGLKRSELFIVFRENGQWGIPVSLGEEVNRSVGNVEAKLSPDHRRLYFATAYTPTATYPTDPATIKRKLEETEWNTGSSNIWFISLDKWLNKR